MAGARAAAPIASAWAAISHLGVEGYTDIMRDLMDVVGERASQRSTPIDGIEIVGDPIGPCSPRSPTRIDLYAVGDVMDDRGWHLNRNTEPRGLHVMLSPAHGLVCEQLCSDLRDAVAHHGAAREARRATPELAAVGGPSATTC